MFYKINEDGSASPCDATEWEEQRAGSEDRNIVARYETSEVLVSTVFLGIDHRLDADSCDPLLFETMIFFSEEGKNFWDGKYQERYCTLQEALIGHEKAVKLVKSNLKDSIGVLLCKKIGSLFADIVRRL